MCIRDSASTAWVGGGLVICRLDGLPRHQFQLRASAASAHRLFRGTYTCACSVAEEIFHQSVLQRVEADHRQAATGLQQADGGSQAAFHFVEFAVDGDAQGLEHSRGWVAARPSATANLAFDQLGQLGCRAQRPVGDDGTGGGPAGGFLATRPGNAGQVCAGEVVSQSGGRAAAVLPMAARRGSLDCASWSAAVIRS